MPQSLSLSKNHDILSRLQETDVDAQVDFYARILFLYMPGLVTANSAWFAKIKRAIARRPRGEMGEWLKPDASKASVP
jgi:hypothetical protein